MDRHRQDGNGSCSIFLNYTGIRLVEGRVQVGKTIS